MNLIESSYKPASFPSITNHAKKIYDMESIYDLRQIREILYVFLPCLYKFNKVIITAENEHKVEPHMHEHKPEEMHVHAHEHKFEHEHMHEHKDQGIVHTHVHEHKYTHVHEHTHVEGEEGHGHPHRLEGRE